MSVFPPAIAGPPGWNMALPVLRPIQGIYSYLISKLFTIIQFLSVKRGYYAHVVIFMNVLYELYVCHLTTHLVNTKVIQKLVIHTPAMVPVSIFYSPPLLSLMVNAGVLWR